ncbi:MAG: hypothetical protein JSW34_01445 [Candidatus Zixiibacteriota bacterium]|nr:MAG: hypothetical protein JSW34_01445 [candidate division Zixibacteria bacterium]
MSKSSLIKYLAAAAAFSLGLFACEEIDVPYVIDEEEIMRYIVESDVGVELFRTDSLLPSNPYVIPDDPDAFYVDRVDSVTRIYDIYILVDNFGSEDREYIQDFGPPIGVTRGAEATVTDNFYIRTIRYEGGDSTVYHMVRPVIRYGFFVKLGDDNQAFRGWLLMAFSGGGPFARQSWLGTSRVQGIRPDNTTFPADSVTYYDIPFLMIDITNRPWDTLENYLGRTRFSYLWLNGDPQVTRIDDGAQLRFRVTELGDSTLFYTLAGETTGDFAVSVLQPDSDSLPVASISTPSDNSRPWNVVYLQEFCVPSGSPVTFTSINALEIKGWCVPYRVGD